MGSMIERIKEYKLTDYLSIISLIFLLSLFTARNVRFISSISLKNMLTDMAPLLIMGIGVTVVLLIGSIDLSIGSVASCGAVLVAVLLPKIGWPTYFIVVFFGIAVGAVNGFIINKLKVPSFITTLGTMSLLQSMAYIFSDGKPLQIGKESWHYLNWSKVNFGIINMLFAMAILMLLLAHIVLTRTELGKHIYATGGNEKAASFSGVKVARIKMLAFMICGMFSAICGMILAMKLKSGVPTVGVAYNLLGIVAVVLGGTTLTGGKGSVLKTLVGVAIVIVIKNGMNMVGVDVYWQDITFGALVIGAVLMTADRKGRNLVVK